MYMLTILLQNKKSQYWIFLSVLVFLALFMMYCNGLSSSYSGFDFFFHFRRLDVLIDALKHGEYISYIDYSNVDGYGYFTKGFYPDFILVPFAVVGIFTGTYFAYDFMIFSMTILCGMFMYHAVCAIYKSRYAAAIASILYTFAVYRLYDIYQRGALSEALSFTFLPIVFLGLYHIIKGDYKKWYILAIGYILLIYTHAIASVLMFVTLLIISIAYCKCLTREPKRIGYLFLAGAVTLVGVSYFTLPLLEQLNSNSFYLDSRTPGGGAGYGKVGFDDLFWGFVSGLAYPDKLWSGIGIILTLVIFLRLFIRKKRDEALKSIDTAVIIGICFIIATSRIFPWGRFPFNILSFIQYPWRLYEFVSFFFAIAGGYYLSLLLVKHKQKLFGFIFIILATLITIYIHSENFKTLFPLKDKTIAVISEIPSFDNRYHTIGGEYFPSKLPNIEYVRDRGEIVEVKNNETKTYNLKRGNRGETDVNIVINQPDTVILPLLYYKGYEVTLNRSNVPFFENENGLIAVPVNQSGKIMAWYAGTNVQEISFYISMACMIGLIIFVARYSRKQKNERNR